MRGVVLNSDDLPAHFVFRMMSTSDAGSPAHFAAMQALIGVRIAAWCGDAVLPDVLIALSACERYEEAHRRSSAPAQRHGGRWN